MLISLRQPTVSDLDSEGEVHIQLVREDHRVPWWTQREIEGHMEEEDKEPRCGVALLIQEVERKE